MDFRILSFAFLVFLSCWSELYGDNSAPTVTGLDFPGRCSPIVLAPGRICTIITRRLFTEKDYEIAILPSFSRSEDSFLAYIIRKDESGYLCERKRIRASDVLIGNEISPKLVAECEIETKSKAIDAQSVETLSSFLRDKVSKATYEIEPNMLALGALDGQTYDVYVKGRLGDVYHDYSGCITDPLAKSSRSCSTITFVLAQFVLLDDDKDRTEPLNELIGYLKSLAEGKPEGVDPFSEKKGAEPDIILPPR